MQTGTNSNSATAAVAAAVPAAPCVPHLGPLARAAQHKLSKGATTAVAVRPIVTSEGSPLLSTAKLSGLADVAASNHAMVNLLHKHSPGTDRKQLEDRVEEVAPDATDADPELTSSDDEEKEKKKKKKQQNKKKRKAKTNASDEPDQKRLRFVPNGFQSGIRHQLVDKTSDRNLLNQEATKYMLGDAQTFNRSQVARVARVCMDKIVQLTAEANKSAGVNDHEECNRKIADAIAECTRACNDRDDSEEREKETKARLEEMEKVVEELTKIRQDLEAKYKAQKDQLISTIAACAASATVAGFASKKKDNDSQAVCAPVATAPAPLHLISFPEQAKHIQVLIEQLEKLGGLIDIGVERDKLREEHGKCASTISEMQVKYDALSASQVNSSNNVTRLVTEKKNLVDLHNKLVEDHAKCADTVSKLQGDVEQFKKHLHSAGVANTRYLSDNTQLLGKNAALTSENAELNKRLSDLVKSSKEEHDHLAMKLFDANSDIDAGNSRYKLQQSDHNTKLVEKDTAHEKAISELNKQLEDLKASTKLQIDELAKKNDNLSTRNAGFATSLADAKRECSEWKNRATALASALSSQKKMFDDASEILGQANGIAPVKRSRIASNGGDGDDDDTLIDIASKDNDDTSRLDPSDVSTSAVIPDSQPTEDQGQDQLKPASSSTASITSSSTGAPN